MKSYDCIFLDRDGTLNPDPGYVKDINEFQFYSFTINSLIKLAKNKNRFCIVSNQSGLAKGQFDLSEFFKIIFKLDSKLSAIGAYVDDFLVCPHFTKLKYKNFNESFFSNYRKPNPGMM